MGMLSKQAEKLLPLVQKPGALYGRGTQFRDEGER